MVSSLTACFQFIVAIFRKTILNRSVDLASQLEMWAIYQIILNLQLGKTQNLSLTNNLTLDASVLSKNLFLGQLYKY